MVSSALFEALEAVARAVKRSEKPFGGIQLVLCGDWLQLPPVVANSSSSLLPSSSFSSSSSSRFAFQAPCWERCVPREMLLSQVHRQEGDPAFVSLLGKFIFSSSSEIEAGERECKKKLKKEKKLISLFSFSTSSSPLFSPKYIIRQAQDRGREQSRGRRAVPQVLKAL